MFDFVNGWFWGISNLLILLLVKFYGTVLFPGDGLLDANSVTKYVEVIFFKNETNATKTAEISFKIFFPS